MLFFAGVRNSLLALRVGVGRCCGLSSVMCFRCLVLLLFVAVDCVLSSLIAVVCCLWCIVVCGLLHVVVCCVSLLR